ncbi:MAG: DNA primase DnaG [Candidatus Micrarchaeia archaeon]
MGKTYIDTVKYMVRASFEVDGLVEKPDIVGALFGQTEGLLGDELDLRELQKNGRVGRIEVTSSARGGKSYGTILLPSSLDMVETSILAAAIEIVDRVGPCEARINVEKIEDTRSLKRKQVLSRAKQLLKALLTEEIPESKELSEMVREDAKISDVESYGPDQLPAGPEMASSDSIIMVEGRADVINLLRNGIKNAVAIGGANVGETIAKLGREKEVTAFLDGDRGGDIILKELMDATDVDYVARAPTGKEVEELTRKELIQALRRRVPLDQGAGDRGRGRRDFQSRREPEPRREPTERREPEPRREEGGEAQRRDEFKREEFVRREPTERREEVVGEAPRRDAFRREEFVRREPEAPVADIMTPEELVKVTEAKRVLKELEGSLKARLLSQDSTTLSEVPIREIMKVLSETKGVEAAVLDGIVTQRLVDLAEQKGVKFLVGIRSGNLTRKPPGLKIILGK